MDFDDEDDFQNALSGQFSQFDNMFDGSTRHAADAMDFSDEDELAEEEELAPEGTNLEEPEDDFMKDLETEAMEGVDDADGFNQGLFGDDLGHLPDTVLNEPDMADLSDDDEPETKPVQPKKSGLDKKERDAEILKFYFPEFRRGAPMKMSQLFSRPVASYQFQKPPKPQPLIPTKVYFDIEPDSRKIFRTPVNTKLGLWQQQQRLQQQNMGVAQQRIITIPEQEQPQVEEKRKNLPEMSLLELKDYDKDIILSTADWNDQDIIEGDSKPHPNKRLKIESVSLDGWADNDDMILEGNLDLAYLNLKLDMNDGNLVLLEQEDGKQKAEKALIPATNKLLDLKFNVSNDKEYQVLMGSYESKIRATIGHLGVVHSSPAIRLQTPYYPVKMPKMQMRNFHRARFVVRPNTIIQFSKVKTRKKKRDKGKDVKDIFAKSTDLSLGDSAPFFLMEYTEEMPIALSSFGMGSKIVNYYRKLTEDDNQRRKCALGETQVLGVQDRSPFWNFGFVRPGEIVQTLYNKMVRAPIFAHQANPSDFLLVRSAGGGNGTRYFLRNVDYAFTVGQTFPVVEVPGPHSRKVTTTSKNRLKMIVFRILNKNAAKRLSVKDISSHFLDQNDMQNRQRLKEFMEYQRSGEHQGYWRVKPNEHLPNFEGIRNMISPEDIALLEAMQAAQLRLKSLEAFGDEVYEDEKKKEVDESLEEQLTPWSITRNFISATQGKAMLRIHGIGDPSTRGEQFSFLKTSMKGGFKAINENNKDVTARQMEIFEMGERKKKGPGRPAHGYNVASQQKAYEREIRKVWLLQQKALSRGYDDLRDEYFKPQLEHLKDDTILQKMNKRLDSGQGVIFSKKDKREKVERRSSQVLRITRMVRDEHGIVQRVTDVVKDPKVIKAYIKRKQKMETAELNPEKLALTNDEEKNKRHKKFLEEELARLTRNQERRIARKAMKQTSSPGKTEGESKKASKKSTTRKCAACGATGHIKTKKSCPLYNSETPTEGQSPAKEPSVSTPV